MQVSYLQALEEARRAIIIDKKNHQQTIHVAISGAHLCKLARDTCNDGTFEMSWVKKMPRPWQPASGFKMKTLLLFPLLSN